MRGPRRRRQLAPPDLNEFSSEEESSGESGEQDLDLNETEEAVPNVSQNPVRDSANNGNTNRRNNLMQPDSSSSSNSGGDEGSSDGAPQMPIEQAECDPNNDRDLSQEEMDKLVQLQDLTGIDDLQICRALLESKNWDLEATAREQFDPQEERSPPAAHRQNIMTHDEAPEAAQYQHFHFRPDLFNDRLIQGNSNVSQGGHHDYPRRTFPQSASNTPSFGSHIRRQHQTGVYGILRWFYSGVYFITLPITWPVRITFNAAASILGFFANLMGVGHLWSQLAYGGRSRRFLPRPPITDPLGDVNRFKESFDEQYGLAHPSFYNGIYSTALDEAKRDLRFLLVYLHCPSHEDSDNFCTNAICSPELTTFVAERNMIFWGCSVESGEGYRVSEALRESTYPFLAVIVLRQNRMMIVGRLEGAPTDPTTLVQRLNKIVQDNEAFIVAARADRAERHMNQTIRQEQDAAFQETLRQDQERERIKQEAEEAKKREEEAEQQRVRAEQDRKERIAKAKIECAVRIPSEPEKTDPNVVRILIKLPEGQRLERRFLKTHSLKYLYYYVFCHPDSPDDFDITTNFPRKVLNCKPKHLIDEIGPNFVAENMPNRSPANEGCSAIHVNGLCAENEDPISFEAAGIGQSTMLFVNDLEA